MKISIVFFGMNHDSLPFFDSLLENKDVDICAVVTNRMDLHMDFILSKKGIKEKLRRFAKYMVRKPILGFIPNRKKKDSTTIESLARHRNIPIFDSALLNEQRIIKKLKNLDTDLFIVGYFNRILRKEIIDIPREGTINIHPSLLPKYGGADPFFWTIKNAEKESGVTIHFIDEKIDTGDIIYQKRLDIEKDWDSEMLKKRSEELAIQMLKEVKNLFLNKSFNITKQDLRKATYYPPAGLECRMIDWSLKADAIMRLVRACKAYRGAIAYLNGRRVRIFDCEPSCSSNYDINTKPGEIVGLEDNWIIVRTVDSFIKVQAMICESNSKLLFEEINQLHIGNRFKSL